MKKIKNLVKNLIGGVVGVGLVLGFFYVLGFIMSIIECHTWLLIPLGIIVFCLLIKEC